MAQRTRLEYKGEDCAALELDFEIEKEGWNIYIAEDGTRLRMKVVVTKLVRIEGHFDEEGNPVYLVKSGNMVVASAPEHLRDPKGKKDNG